MNAPFKHPAIHSNFLPTHLDHLDWSDQQPGETRKPGTFRSIDLLLLLIRQSVSWIARRHRRHTAVQALNDHYLKDIGLDRDQILSSVEKAEVAGKPA